MVLLVLDKKNKYMFSSNYLLIEKSTVLMSGQIKCLLEKSDQETKRKQEREQKRIQEENKIYEIEPKTEKPVRF